MVEEIRFLVRQPFLLHVSLQATVLKLAFTAFTAFTAFMSVFVLFVVGPSSTLGLPPIGRWPWGPCPSAPSWAAWWRI